MMITLLAVLVLRGDAEKAVLAWAKEVEAEFALQDPCPSIDRLFDLDVLLDRVFQGTGTLEKLEPKFREEFKPAFELDKGICRGAVERGGYRLLKVWTDGAPRALFRLVTDSGFNYHEWRLGISDGRVRIHDVFLYQAGEDLSESYRRAFLRSLSRRADLPEALPEGDKELLEKARKKSALLDAGARGDAEEVFRLYGDLPEELRGDKVILLARARAGQAAAVRAGLEALKDLERHFPDAAFAAFNAFSGYAALRQHDKSLEALAKLATFTGRDGYQTLQIAEIAFQRGEHGRALELYREAAKQDPSLAEPHWGVVGSARELKDFKAMVAAMSALEDEHDVRFPALAANKTFAEFAKSEVYAAWLASRGPRGEKTYDVRLPQKPRAGTAVEFSNLRRFDLKTTTLKGGIPVNERVFFDGHSFRGLMEIMEVEGRRPTHVRVTFRKAARRVEGKTRSYGFEGKTVVVRGFEPADLKATYENGEELKGEEREGVLRALSQDENKKGSDADSAEAFFPKEPLRVGESWEPDMEKLARDFEGGPMKIDPKAGRASFTLRSVEKREGLEFAQLRGRFVLSMTGLGDLQLDRGIPMVTTIQAEACVTGELPDGGIRGTIGMDGESTFTPPGEKEPLTLRLKLKGGGQTTQRSVE